MSLVHGICHSQISQFVTLSGAYRFVGFFNAQKTILRKLRMSVVLGMAIREVEINCIGWVCSEYRIHARNDKQLALSV